MCKTYFHFQLEETEEQSEYEELLHSIPTRPASPSPSTSAFKTKPPASKKSKIDDLLIKFLDRLRPEEVFSKQVFNVNTIGVKCTLQIVCLQLYFTVFILHSVLLYFTVIDMYCSQIRCVETFVQKYYVVFILLLLYFPFRTFVFAVGDHCCCLCPCTLTTRRAHIIQPVDRGQDVKDPPG